MSENVVPLVRTSIDMPSYARALMHAWRSELGVMPTKEQMGVLYAQYGIETGGPPKAACWNNNPGNVKHVPGDGYDYCMLPNTWEMINGKRVVFQPPHPATWFRAYPTLEAGMLHHFRFLRGKRYGVAWEGVDLGDCGLFARRLKAAGYYTADATTYTNGMLAHFRKWMTSEAFEKALADITERDIKPANDVDDAATIDGGIVRASYYKADDEPPPSAA